MYHKLIFMNFEKLHCCWCHYQIYGHINAPCENCYYKMYNECHHAVRTGVVLSLAQDKCTVANQAPSNSHRDEGSFCWHHLSCSTSTRLSVLSAAPVSACPPTHMHTQTLDDVCVKMHVLPETSAHIAPSNAVINNLAIHTAQFCHPIVTLTASWDPL